MNTAEIDLAGTRGLVDRAVVVELFCARVTDRRARKRVPGDSIIETSGGRESERGTVEFLRCEDAGGADASGFRIDLVETGVEEGFEVGNDEASPKPDEITPIEPTIEDGSAYISSPATARK